MTELLIKSGKFPIASETSPKLVLAGSIPAVHQLTNKFQRSKKLSVIKLEIKTDASAQPFLVVRGVARTSHNHINFSLACYG